MRLSLRLAILTALLCPVFAETPPRCASERLQGKTDILPNEPSEYESIGAEYLKKELGDALTEELLKVLERKADGAWKTFQDDLVSFEYPDDPLLRVTPIEPGEEFGIVGGAIGNADRSFERAYRLVAGPKIPYLTIFVQQTDRFDDGICLCGPVVHDQLLVADGTLLRFSFLPSGAIKKVQALGAKHRAIALEWTHTAITQEAFARIGKSLRMREPGSNTREQWMTKLAADNPPSPDWPASKSKLRRDLAWMEPQMTPAAVRSLLGTPAKSTEEGDFFEEKVRTPDGQHWRFTTRVPYRDGRFIRFDAGRSEAEELEPQPGSVRWAEKLLHVEERQPIPGLDDDKPRPKPSTEAAKALVEAFLKRADEENGAHWRRWCEAMAAAAFELKLGDARILARVEETFLELPRDQMGAIDILRAAPSSRLVELCLSRARLIADEGITTAAADRTYEFSKLISAVVEADAKGAEKFVRAALTDPKPAVRRSALDTVSQVMGPNERLQLYAGLLDDPDPVVRRGAADVTGWWAATRADLSKVEIQLRKETDPATADAMRELAKWIRENAEK